MKSRERLLTALENKKPDRLPCQVHNFMNYYLKTFMHGMTDIEAYRYFGLDIVLYREPNFIYNKKDLENWKEESFDLGQDKDGNHFWKKVVTTPKGQLITAGAGNQYTIWTTELPIKSDRDFEIWNEYLPLPIKVDWSPVVKAKEMLGDDGIVRGSFFDFGQGSPWQSYVGFFQNLEETIYRTVDEPSYVHFALKAMLEKKMKVIETAGKFEYDLVETGGGAGSSTVISPNLHMEFCLPYDRIQHKAIKEAGSKVVYHLCGGLMPLLEIVAENGADALETMTPAAMGGDCNLLEANKRVGDKLCFIGGFDQNSGFEQGTPAAVEKMVQKLFESKPQGGYICSPSDHFFKGNPENIKAFVNAAKNCRY